MSEVASAYISLLPSARGFGRRTESLMDAELGGTGSGGVGAKQGRSIGTRLVGGMGKVLKTGMLATGAAVGGIFATALVKGFGRLNAIDQAEAKLRGLGHTAEEITQIMQNATDAVTGTAFGLDEAATAAASALASGIKPGKELTEYLTLIADAATQGGASFNEMAAIINKTTATGKVGMENLNQLSERGIGIMSWLAEEYGVTGAELAKMVSKGEVDLETFRKVLNERIGGAAQESGATFSGALANMNAALGRLGAKMLSGVFKQMPAFFSNIGATLDKLGPYAEAFGEALGKGFTAAGKFLTRFSKSLAGLFSGGNGKGLRELVATVQKNLVPVLETAADTFRTVVLPAAEQFGQYLYQQLGPVFTQVWGIIQRQVLPILSSLAQFFYGTVYPAVVRIVTVVGGALKPVFEALVQVVRNNVLPTVEKLLAKFREAQPSIESVIQKVLAFVEVLAKVAATILAVLLPPILKLWGWLFEKIYPFLANVFIVAWKILDGALSAVGWYINNVLIPAWSLWWTAVKKIATWIWDRLKPAIDAIKTAFEPVKTVLKWIWDNVSKIFGAMTEAIRKAVDKVRDLSNGLMDVLDKLGLIDNAKWGRPKGNPKLQTLTGQSILGSSIGRNADGTSNWRGGLTWVGEEGPELLDLPKGSRIRSHEDSLKLLKSFQSSLATAAPAPSLDGMSISGTLDLGNGLTGFVEGVLNQRDRDLTRQVRAGAY